MNNNNTVNNNNAEAASGVKKVAKEVVNFMRLLEEQGGSKKAVKQTVALCLCLLAVYAAIGMFGGMVAEKVIEKKWSEVTILDRNIEKLNIQAEKADLIIKESKRAEETLTATKGEIAALQTEAEHLKEILTVNLDTLKGIQKQVGEKTDELVKETEQLAAAKKASEEANANLRFVSARISEKDTELTKVTEQLAAAKKASEEANANLQFVSARISEKDTELTKVSDTLSSAQKASDDAVANSEAVLGELARAQNDLSVVKDEIAGMSVLKESLSKEISDLNAAKSAAKTVAAAKEESFTSKITRSFAAMQSAWSSSK